MSAAVQKILAGAGISTRPVFIYFAASWCPDCTSKDLGNIISSQQLGTAKTVLYVSSDAVEDKTTYDDFANRLEQELQAKSDMAFVKVRDAEEGARVEAELKKATQSFSGKEGRDDPQFSGVERKHGIPSLFYLSESEDVSGGDVQ